MAVFDSIQKAMFSQVGSIFGDIATWYPSDGSDPVSEKVLYNCPEVKGQIGDEEKYDYNPYNYWFEFFETQLVGLKLSVDNGNLETVQIKNDRLEIKQVVRKSDGKTLVAYCELAPPQQGIDAMEIPTTDEIA